MSDDPAGEYGGFWMRLLAYAADCGIVLLAALVLGIVSGMIGLITLGGILIFLLQLLYWPVMQASARQATFGKSMLGLKVLGPDGGRLSFLRSLGRELAKIVSMLPLMIGFLLAAFTGKKQALHDMIASTTVVRVGPAHVGRAMVVSLLGIVGPMIAIPLLGVGLLAMFGFGMKGMEAQMREDMKKAMQSQAPASRSASPVAAPPSAPQSVVPRAPMGQTINGPDPEFDAAVGAPIASFARGSATRSGPAVLELSTVFGSSFWVKVYLPAPASGDPELVRPPRVTVNRVLDAAGTNYHDAGNTFEQRDFFRRPTLSAATQPVPHLAGTRTVHVRAGLTAQNLAKVEGQLNFDVPVDPRRVSIEAGELGKEKSAHTASVKLVALDGAKATLRYRGASEHLLAVRGFGKDGATVPFESRPSAPENSDVDMDLGYLFKAPVTRLEVVVAARVIERFYPFSLAAGAVAGPPGSGPQGITLAPRQPVNAAVAAAQPKPAAPQPAPVAPAPQPKAAAEPAPPPAPAPVAVASSRPAARPVAAPPPAPPRAEPSVAAARLAALPEAPPLPALERSTPAAPSLKYNDLGSAILNRDPATVEMLLKMGKWPDKPDSHGMTPLMLAAQAGDVRSTELLLKAGANPNLSVRGESASSIAQQRGEFAILDLLQKHGAR